MSSPNHSTSDIEDAFSSMNILNYTSVSPDYFPASAGSRSFNSSKNSTDNMIPPVFSSLKRGYMRHRQAQVLLGLKDFKMILRVTAAQSKVSTAGESTYYCLCSVSAGEKITTAVKG
ncbi:hypothetical protein Tco_0090557 [Tanacetum coccineum]